MCVCGRQENATNFWILMTFHQASTVQFLTLNPDVLRIIGEYLDLKSKYRLKQVNVQTFSPAWPIVLCEFPHHYSYISHITHLNLLTKRYYSTCDEDGRCTRCSLLTCLACADFVCVQSCEICGKRLCLVCQKQTGITFIRCGECGVPVCVSRQTDEEEGTSGLTTTSSSSSRKVIRKVACVNCFDAKVLEEKTRCSGDLEGSNSMTTTTPDGPPTPELL
jgi:hypothetical protein